MVLRSIMMEKFWRDWEDRFMREHDRFITPSSNLVQEESNKVGGSCCGGCIQKATNVWLHINRNIQYKLSKKWKTPDGTLKDGIGDCEDMDFLMLSMLPHTGVEKAKLAAGHLKTPSNSGPHTWVVVNGKVMDPTGTPQDVQRAEYRKEIEFSINYE